MQLLKITLISFSNLFLVVSNQTTKLLGKGQVDQIIQSVLLILDIYLFNQKLDTEKTKKKQVEEKKVHIC